MAALDRLVSLLGAAGEAKYPVTNMQVSLLKENWVLAANYPLKVGKTGNWARCLRAKGMGKLTNCCTL